MEFDQLMASGSLLIAFVSLISTTVIRIKSDAKDEKSLSMKMDFQTQILEETIDCVKSIEGRVNDMDTRIAKLESSSETLFHKVNRNSERIDKIEDRLIVHNMGGTD